MGFRDGRVRNNGPEQNWKEYAGACLLNPMEADSSYRFEFDVGFVNEQRSPPINITFLVPQIVIIYLLESVMKPLDVRRMGLIGLI